MRWEYAFVRITADDTEATREMNRHGSAGWELMSLNWVRDEMRGQGPRIFVVDPVDADYGLAWLKRPKPVRKD